MKEVNIQRYLDQEGKVILWPSKPARKKAILEYLITKLEIGKNYSEKEVSALLNQHHIFGDAALLRREMVGRKLLDRTRDCRAYWVIT